ncbi:MAG: GntR-family transcriptional regulator [Glaciihabitans sp.]|nr:GntR-family transcriptional regulator [Glaciihabitans sp.]
MTVDAARADDDNTSSSDRYRPGYELVAEQLLHYVADEGLQAGDRLPTEQGLAEILGATRNVTREAVKVLAALGRLNVRKGAGIFMAEPRSTLAEELLTHFQPTDIDHVVMLLDHRRLIEAETARRAAGLATPAEVRIIREAAQRSIAESKVDNVNEFAEADAQFHMGIAVAAHNVFLEASVTSLRRYAAQSDLLVFHGDVPGSFEVAASQHLAIAAAIANGEPEIAAALMEEHVDTTRHQFERKLKDRMFNFNRTNDNRLS